MTMVYALILGAMNFGMAWINIHYGLGNKQDKPLAYAGIVGTVSCIGIIINELL